MPPPPYPTLLGSLVVFAGTIVVGVGLLPGHKSRKWTAKSNAIGTCIIGGGAGVSFLGTARKLSPGDIQLLNWGLLVLAVLLIVAILAPYVTPRVNPLARLGKDHHADTKDGDAGDPDNAEDDLSIYMIAFQDRVP
jgi:hypothetical protein